MVVCEFGQFFEGNVKSEPQSLERAKNWSGLEWGIFLFFVLYVICTLFLDTYAEVLFA